MSNNWQILDMWESLIQTHIKCGGSPDEVSAQRLSRLTALELMELLAPNDVRFCIKKKPRELLREMGLGIIALGDNLDLEHQPSSARFLLIDGEKTVQIPILYKEMEKLIDFVNKDK